MNTLRITMLAVLLVALTALPSQLVAQETKFESKRPPESERCFTSPTIEKTIADVKGRIADSELAWMFENCYPNTLDTTVDYEVIDGKPDTFIITGDIDAMWLRDSTAQVWPYMPYIKQDEKLRKLVEGLVRRQTKCVLLDPYANAFYKDMTRESHWKDDRPTPIDGVHERKWEIDSLCYTIRLANEYYQLTGDASIFDEDWQRGAKKIVETFRTEQRKNGTPFRFIRKTDRMLDAPPFDGTGRPVEPVGLIASAFRPSDDSTLFPFLIPSNLFAVQSLGQMETIFRDVVGDEEFADECQALADEVQTAINKYAKVNHLDFGEIYAYEVDGHGNKVFWDDANVPSLMSLAYLGVHKPTDPIYMRTRKFLLSENNPYYFRGTAAEGQASPHTGKVRIWPMGIILRAMTSTSDDEITQCLTMLKNTHAGTGFMHEAFNKDDPQDYTRDWFAWANTLFGELIVKVDTERPELLKQPLE
ncbi:glycoside hydrolase family 125 protein [Aeoliella sp. ICT_H6.2]|uniref:Glycoside hydrolase family 125 protein n=1 Tax=Aeoliella straminimaris TaxID=2954799 RepID=A0A9X2JGV2_9BACT|nr:glycoside hydrolase family 125 protein [Aeoliella straminimaris]MCO6043963.1 glycoside hydrolase family 125 protein [Aeoliella straminimaris]